MKNIVIIISLIVGLQISILGQIGVNPTGVNVNSQNPTTVFLTFGPIPPNYVPAEAIWCGALIPATLPAVGQQCRPGSIYGALPARLNQSTGSGNSGFTDIMGIPPSVVRRAYQAAQNGGDAGFFYVRRFVSTNGAPDQFVAVTCRMSGGGARVPFALTNVEIETPSEKPILFINSGEKFPKISAKIKYNGTGRLKGRWEIVRPGEEAPKARDLLTEATLPIEQRASQKRYTQISRFNHFLPPIGEFELPLELPDRVPTLAKGQYLLLLRIEATDDKEGSSNLASVGVGNGTVSAGAVASFPMPFLKFFITGEGKSTWSNTALVLPRKETPIDLKKPLVFGWKELPAANTYRLEVLDSENNPILAAMLLAPNTTYEAPSWFWSRFANNNPSWRVIALDQNGKEIGKTEAQRIVMLR
ncbi:MAG: hypothetical protein HKN25_06310 [Pyrinomonadaceae bacterium]|nr:hypothetical protein [Pyrinomonadaceae bacterium]